MKEVQSIQRRNKCVDVGTLVLVAFGLSAVAGIGVVAQAARTGTPRGGLLPLDAWHNVFDPFELTVTPLATDDDSGGSSASSEPEDDYFVVPPICIPQRPYCRSPHRPPCAPRWPKGPPDWNHGRFPPWLRWMRR